MTYNADFIKNILGEELFQESCDLFQDFFERESKFKIVLTRRGLTLLRIFRPILEANNIFNDKNSQIITDNALPLYLSAIQDLIKMSEDTETDEILLLDDIVIFGRTMSSIIDSLLEGLDEIKRKIGLKNIFARCFLMNTAHSCIREEYLHCVFPQEYGSASSWRALSCAFSKLIKSVDVSNTSYIVSQRLSSSKMGSSDVLRYLKEHYTCNSTEELTKLSVHSFVASVSTKYPYIACSYIRICYYEKLDSLLITPLIIPKELSLAEYDTLKENVLSYLNLSDKSQIANLLSNENRKFFSVKFRFLILLLNQLVLREFLMHNTEFEYNLDTTDYVEIIETNFSKIYLKEFRSIFSRKEYPSCISKYEDNANEQEFNKEFESFLFQRAMMDNRAALNREKKRLDGFSFFGDSKNSIFAKENKVSLLSCIDTGRASLRSSYKESAGSGSFESLLYPGEQAFRFVLDNFGSLLFYFISFENFALLNNLNVYKIYYKFADKLKEHLGTDKFNLITKYINTLEQTNLLFSDFITHNKEFDQSTEQGEVEDIFKNFCKKEGYNIGVY